MGIAAVEQLTKPEPKPLGAVHIECDYPVVALALKEILKDEAEVFEGRKQLLGREEDISSIVLCPNGKDVASEVRRLKATIPEAAVLVFDMRVDQRHVQEAIRAGASGFVHAGMHPRHIVGALRLAREGKVVVPKGLLEKLVVQEESPPDLTVLTPRQREIVELVCEGMSNAQIAERLYLTESTVKQHLRAAYKLLKVSNRVQAAKLLRDT